MDLTMFDEQPLFVKYCRRPGTRCAKIMQMIDDGKTDEEIAERWRTTKYDIAVYRKAHDGTLTTINHDYMPSTERI